MVCEEVLTTNQLNPRPLRFVLMGTLKGFQNPPNGNRGSRDDRERDHVGRAMSFATVLCGRHPGSRGLHYYIWARLMRDTRLPQPWAALLLAALVVLAAGLPFMRLVIRRWPAVARILGWPFYTWLGVSMLLFFLLMGTDIVRLAGLARKQGARAAATE